MSRSIAFKWIVTLVFTSLVGVILVGLFAYRTTVMEFDRLRVDQAQADFVDEMAAYYETYHNWDGLEDWFHDQDSAPGHETSPQMRQSGAVLDTNGIVVLSSGPFRQGQQVSPEQINQGTAIVVDDQTVGSVLVTTQPPRPDPREQQYLDRTNQALLIGAVGAGSMALLVGLLLSRRFLRPLVELTTAIRGMRQGELSQQVQVRTQDELGELAQAFNQMSADIHRANQLRTQMTADIAHDLRTPLTVIMGYLEGLRDNTLKPTPQRFEAMYNEAVLLNRLIDDLRTLSLADAGELKLVYQMIQPSELLEQVKQSFEPLAEAGQITLQVTADDDLPDVRVDRERMGQVLINLVANALRYTQAGGSVTLQARKREDKVQLLVSDTGSGIPADKLPNIFERFYRVEEARSQNQGESGLGLAIAKSIIEAHHGTITAQSQVGNGTTMTITLQTAAD